MPRVSYIKNIFAKQPSSLICLKHNMREKGRHGRPQFEVKEEALLEAMEVTQIIYSYYKRTF
jgi:hypothetical protein